MKFGRGWLDAGDLHDAGEAAVDGATPDETFRAQLDSLEGSSVLVDAPPGDPAELAAEPLALRGRSLEGPEIDHGNLAHLDLAARRDGHAQSPSGQRQ